MVDDQLVPWEAEPIPDNDHLYLRVHVNGLDAERQLHPGIFRDRNGMSTDWSRYSTPEEARARSGKPELNGLVALVAGIVRSVEGLSVQHTPLPANRAHTDVHGIGTSDPRKTELRERLFDRAALVWLIEPVDKHS